MNFAPTELSKQNLLKEGRSAESVFVTGNTAIDALKTMVRADYTHEYLDWAKDSRLIMITAHRRENLGEPMKNMFRVIRRIVEPLDVLDFHNFLSRSYLILTDSGGIQEEAPSLGKLVLVMRDTTERPEGIEAGTLRLVGTDEETIYQNFKLLLENEDEYNKMSKASNPYGDSHACERIADILVESDLNIFPIHEMASKNQENQCRKNEL